MKKRLVTRLPAVDVKSGKLILTSNVFHQKKLSVSLNEDASQAVIQGMYSGKKDGHEHPRYDIEEYESLCHFRK